MNGHEEFDEVELQALHDAARALPRDITPNPAAWSAIRNRIEQARVRELVPGAVTGAVAGSGAQPDVMPATNDAPRPVSHSWMRSTRGAMLVAASLFVVVTTWVVRREPSLEHAEPSRYAADTGRADMAGVFARYDGAATDLQNDLARRRPTLDPGMVAVLDSCLVTIDEAIDETRSALRESPDNATISELLEVTYQQKLDLLRRVADLAESFQ